jgi:hypothetical protein
VVRLGTRATVSSNFRIAQAHARCLSNANVPTLLAALAPKAIVIYGVATDFCDPYTVEDPRRIPAGGRVIHATAVTFWRPILLS